MLINPGSRLGFVAKTRATDRSADDREANPRFAHPLQDLMLDLFERILLLTNDEREVLPDVVAEGARGVTADTRRRVLLEDAFNRDGVVGVDPEGELGIKAGGFVVKPRLRLSK